MAVTHFFFPWDGLLLVRMYSKGETSNKLLQANEMNGVRAVGIQHLSANLKVERFVLPGGQTSTRRLPFCLTEMQCKHGMKRQQVGAWCVIFIKA